VYDIGHGRISVFNEDDDRFESLGEARTRIQREQGS
jgi:carbonic anhydrase